jgi:hypothetical protein
VFIKDLVVSGQQSRGSDAEGDVEEGGAKVEGTGSGFVWDSAGHIVSVFLLTSHPTLEISTNAIKSNPMQSGTHCFLNVDVAIMQCYCLTIKSSPFREGSGNTDMILAFGSYLPPNVIIDAT